LLAVVLASAPARAESERPDAERPDVAMYVGMTAGQVTLDSSALSATLARNGYHTLGANGYGATLYDTLRIGRTRIEIGGGLWTVGARDSRIGSTFGGEALATLGYDIARHGGWYLTPRLGAGVGLAQLCVNGIENDHPLHTGSTFDDALVNPGSETCLKQYAFVVRPGASIAYERGMTPSFEKTGFGYRIGATFGYTIPVTTTSWERSNDLELQQIAGPDAPYRGAFVGLEIAFVAGFF
jgi:hypothetical protein